MKILAKVENKNSGDHFYNCNVITSDKKAYNIKLTQENFKDIDVEKVYEFSLEVKEESDKTNYHLKSFKDILYTIDDLFELKETLLKFYPSIDINTKDIKKGIENYLSLIKNPIIKTITENIYQKYEKRFYLYPAAVRFHHAYIGGLSQHTKTMLDLAKPMLELYDFINEDLVYSAIILHDICKVVELSGVEGAEYTKEGQLIGHLVLITHEIIKEATKLGFSESEEVLTLNHILLAHHGLPNFGAAKRPQTAEALLVWFIDTIDSKFEVIKQELEKVEEGTFTPSVAVADKMRFYKHKVK